MESPASSSRLVPRARLVTDRSRAAVASLLRADARRNLLLLDLVERVGCAGGGAEVPPQVFMVQAAGEAAGAAALRPSIVLAADMNVDVLGCLVPYIAALESGLIKSGYPGVTELWQRLRAQGRRALIDRVEFAHLVENSTLRPVPLPDGAKLRPAGIGDLEALVTAARASLCEEGRPDPFDGDPPGFRRWVRGRLHRARVVERAGRVLFVGYADVRRTDGWLVQGVYTWPEARRQGLAAGGMTGLIQEAFENRAEHVQLAVVEGNEPALRLYERLGFRTFERLRTLLFS